MAELELLIVLFGLGIVAYFSFHYRRQAVLRELALPLLGFTLIVSGWTANAFDNGAGDWVRAIEHGLYCCGAIAFTIWTHKLQRGESKWIR